MWVLDSLCHFDLNIERKDKYYWAEESLVYGDSSLTLKVNSPDSLKHLLKQSSLLEWPNAMNA